MWPFEGVVEVDGALASKIMFKAHPRSLEGYYQVASGVGPIDQA